MIKMEHVGQRSNVGNALLNIGHHLYLRPDR